MVLQIVLLLGAVYLLSLLVVRQLSYMLIRITRKRTAVVWLLSLLFFPGTLMHELGHLIFAEFMLVPTADVHLLPEVLEDGTIKLGSVEITQTDPIRRTIIGFAPILSGLIIVGVVTYGYVALHMTILWVQLVYGYILFEVVNSMFSSRKDMEGAVWGLLGMGIIGFAIKFLSEIVSITFVTDFVVRIEKLGTLAAVYLRDGLFYAVVLDMVVLAVVVILIGAHRIATHS